MKKIIFFPILLCFGCEYNNLPNEQGLVPVSEVGYLRFGNLGGFCRCNALFELKNSSLSGVTNRSFIDTDTTTLHKMPDSLYLQCKFLLGEIPKRLLQEKSGIGDRPIPDSGVLYIELSLNNTRYQWSVGGNPPGYLNSFLSDMNGVMQKLK
jgi:hypothetical protein